MFGTAYFGKTYFGGTYFGPNILVTVVVRKKPKAEEDSAPGPDDEYTVYKKEMPKADKDKYLAQIMREDEEIIAIIVAAVESGII